MTTRPMPHARSAGGCSSASLLSVPAMVLAMVGAFGFPGSDWVVLALVTPVILWCALPFHRAAWINARHGAATMDTLISLGALVSYAWSVVGGPGRRRPHVFRGRRSADHVPAGRTLFRGAIEGPRRFGSAEPAEARRQGRRGAARRRRSPARRSVRCGSATSLSSDPASRSPPTASSSTGSSAVDASMLTGESVPVEVAPGDAVVGATTNSGGRLVVRATRVGADTQLAAMARLVTEAQSGKAPVQRLADRIAGVFVPAVIVLALRDLRRLAGDRCRSECRDDRRGRGADRGVPVRARPRHADGVAGRHRSRRVTGHRHPRSADP